jgi:arabinose-5-phosphate isomerase
VLGLKARMGDSFPRAVQAFLDVRGRVVVMGMGKSGHIGRKVAATLASTGTPAMFVHPAEASHGDLGMIKPIDLVLAISNGGESEEITVILPVLKRLGVPLVAMTGNPVHPGTPCRHRAGQQRREGSLPAEPGAHGQHHRAAGAGRRAGRGAAGCARLPAEDFARSHPGGALGRKLLTHLSDVMRSGDAVPRVAPETPFPDLMREMSAKGLGASAIVDAEDRVLGIFTDGDLRRLVEKGIDLRSLRARDVMHPNPRTIRQDALAAEAAELMEKYRITSALVVDARWPAVRRHQLERPDARQGHLTRAHVAGPDFPARAAARRARRARGVLRRRRRAHRRRAVPVRSRRIPQALQHPRRARPEAAAARRHHAGRSSPAAIRSRCAPAGGAGHRPRALRHRGQAPAAEKTLATLGLDWSQAAAIGDDWPDLPVLGRCAFAAAPPNAHIEVKARALRHDGCGRARRRARVLRPAAGGQRPLRAAARGLRVTRRGRRGWHWLRATGDRLAIYLPVFLMGVLALGTYWLASNTPTFFGATETQKPPTHDPDYFMRGFSVKTLRPDRPAQERDLRPEARHYPDTDTLEIDQVRIRSYDEARRGDGGDGQARHQQRDGSEAQLIGDAVVVRDAVPGLQMPRLEFRGEFLHVFSTPERVKSHKPVTLIRGNDRFIADRWTTTTWTGSWTCGPRARRADARAGPRAPKP